MLRLALRAPRPHPPVSGNNSSNRGNLTFTAYLAYYAFNEKSPQRRQGRLPFDCFATIIIPYSPRSLLHRDSVPHCVLHGGSSPRPAGVPPRSWTLARFPAALRVDQLVATASCPAGMADKNYPPFGIRFSVAG
ncbi:unnamed protein product, partial [Iphiclides podalirius]